MRIKFRTMWAWDNWKKSLIPSSWLVAATWAIALLFLAAAPLIIFGNAKTFVIREKSPLVSRSYRKQQHVTFHHREWFTLSPLSARSHNPFIKSMLFIKNIVSANLNRHRGEMQLRQLLIKVNADAETLQSS